MPANQEVGLVLNIKEKVDQKGARGIIRTHLDESLSYPPLAVVRVERQLGYGVPEGPRDFVERVEGTLGWQRSMVATTIATSNNSPVSRMNSVIRAEWENE